MRSWQPGDIDVKGVRLHYARAGGTKPVVLKNLFEGKPEHHDNRHE